MKIVISGGTGFIGQILVKELSDGGHEIVSLTRRRDFSGLIALPGVRYATWDGRSAGGIVPFVDGADAVLNFAAESLAEGRWTKARKKILVDSRLAPITAIVDAIAAARSKPEVLVSASGVGYYGIVDEGDITEEHPPGEDFLATLCARWEAAAMKAEEYGVRVVPMRMAFVLGGKGSGLGRIARAFRFFVGGPLGTGRQWFPWVHVADVVGVVKFILETKTLRGPVNVAAPGAVRMKEFSASLGKAMGRPSWAPVPGFVVRLLVGELGDVVLGGQKAVSAALGKAGYRFRYPALADALKDALRRKT